MQMLVMVVVILILMCVLVVSLGQNHIVFSDNSKICRGEDRQEQKEVRKQMERNRKFMQLEES